MSESPPPSDAAARLKALRERILALDQTLIELVGERRALVLEVGHLKAAMGLPVLDPGREPRWSAAPPTSPVSAAWTRNSSVT